MGQHFAAPLVQEAAHQAGGAEFPIFQLNGRSCQILVEIGFGYFPILLRGMDSSPFDQ